MKVRVAILNWRGAYGAAGRSIWDLAAALDRDQFEARFYFLAGSPGPFAEEIASLGYEVENLHWRDGFSLAGRWRLLRALRRFHPMIIHDHIVSPFTRPLAKLVCRRPVLHTEHGAAIRHAAGLAGWRRLVARLDLWFCDRVLANSFACRDAVLRAYRLPESKIEVLYLGIDLRRFTPTAGMLRQRSRHRVGFVGRVSRWDKGADYLPPVAHALVDMGRSDIEFVVVGDGPDRPAVESLCE